MLLHEFNLSSQDANKQDERSKQAAAYSSQYDEPQASGIVLGAEPPIEQTGTRQTRRRQTAGGVHSVVQAIRYAVGRMGAARGTQALLRLKNTDGFSESGAKALANEGALKRVTPEFFRQHSVHDLLRKSDFWLTQQGRLTQPMLLAEGSNHYEAMLWDDALNLIARELNSLGSPDEAAFYTSGRTSNEAAYLLQLFARQFGTNNLPACSNLCHESSGAALRETIGIGKGTVTLEDFLQAEAIFTIGQNPGANHPGILVRLEAAKADGAVVVTANPLPEPGNFRFKNPRNYFNPLKAIGTLAGRGV